MTFNYGPVIEITGTILLFCLIFGMSATVDVNSLSSQLKNQRAIGTGLFLQFILMPVLGLLVVKFFGFEKPTGLALLIVTSSPGGSYSNWWCSIFNADLALSVAMTGISTLLSIVMLPINLLLYANLAYGETMVENVNWSALQGTLVIIILALGLGLYASDKNPTHEFRGNANRLGNFAGLALIILSFILVNANTSWRVWERDTTFLLGIAAPCILGLLIANVISNALRLHSSERVTVSIECCYQNVGIAGTVALTMFDGDDAAQALGVPFYYGIVEATVVLIYCIVSWKAGWSKAPRDVSLFQAITTSYELLDSKKDSDLGSERKSLCAALCGDNDSCLSKKPNSLLSAALAEKEDDDEDIYCVIEREEVPTTKNLNDAKAENGVNSNSTDDDVDEDGYVLSMA